MVGVYPLFKRSAVNLSGAAVRVHITVTTDTVPHEPQAIEELNSSGEEEEEEEGLPTTVLSRQSQSLSKQLIKSAVSSDSPPSTELINEDTFLANITVDRAMHLSLKGRITTVMFDFFFFFFASFSFVSALTLTIKCCCHPQVVLLLSGVEGCLIAVFPTQPPMPQAQ